jgi:hypothetical protein
MGGIADTGRPGAPSALHLLHHHQAFFTIHLYRDSGTTVRPQSRMALFHSGLDILGIVGSGSNHDHIFEPAGDEELTVVQKSEVTGAQKGTFSGIGQMGFKGVVSGLWGIPIAPRHAAPGEPYFTDPVRSTFGAGIGIDDEKVLIVQTLATPHQGLSPPVANAGDGHLVLLQRHLLHRTDDGGGVFPPSGGHQRGFGKP